jgi:hypothetical protein
MPALAEGAAVAAAVVLAVAGVLSAWASANTAKRVAGFIVAIVFAVIALAALGAPSAALMAGIAIAFAYCVLGVSVLVRMQEAYGSAEVADADAADSESEPREPDA